MTQLTRDEMKQIRGGDHHNACYPITCCKPSNASDCVAGPCIGPGRCSDTCFCDGVIQ